MSNTRHSVSSCFAIDSKKEEKGTNRRQEELAAVRVGASVSHGQDSGSRVLQIEVLVSELLPVNRLAARSVVSRKVPALNHEVGDDPMEDGSLETESWSWERVEQVVGEQKSVHVPVLIRRRTACRSHAGIRKTGTGTVTMTYPSPRCTGRGSSPPCGARRHSSAP